MDNIKKIRTNNVPIVDELVYWVKELALSTVAKSKSLAEQYETLETSKAGNIYVAVIENRVSFETFSYGYDMLISVGMPDALAKECEIDNKKIPMKYREPLIKLGKKLYLESFVEYNNYYRMLNGLPDYQDNNLYIPEYMITEVMLTRGITSNIPLHELSDDQADYLYKTDVIDNIIKLFPNANYLNHLGYKRISIYQARSAEYFALLKCSQDAPSEVYNKYLDKFELNRDYTLRVVYNEAFKLDSDYYDNFISIFIQIQTMIDMFTTLPEMVIRREFFDIDTLKLVFECHDVDFFPEIPFRYQLAMVRNINTLIKYKSTTKNIIDICSLFGFDNVEVFKYYILKQRKVDDEGEFIYPTKEVKDLETGKMIDVPDESSSALYDLKFIKVPIEGICDDYIHNKTSYLDYDDITLADGYWDGELAHDVVREQILDMEFNYLQSKYMSIDTLYSLTELSFDITYFYNMLFDDVLVEEDLTMMVPSIASDVSFKFIDIISYLFALGYAYLDTSDDLMDTPSKILSIKGFNFSANMADLANYLYSKGLTLKDVGIADFQTPTAQIPTYKQMMAIFNTNVKIYNHVVNEMLNADNYHIYEIYKTIYDALMVNTLSLEFFRMSNGAIAKTWTEYIKDQDGILYKSLRRIQEMTNLKSRREVINNLVTNIVYTIEEYINFGKYKYIFDVFPGVSAEAIKMYIYKVVNFFKSYKIDIFGMNSLYKFDDQLQNKIIVIDNIIINHIHNRKDLVGILHELIKAVIETNPKEYIRIKDVLSIEVVAIIERLFDDNLNIKKEITNTISLLVKTDSDGVIPVMESLTSQLYEETTYNIYSAFKLLGSLTPKDRLDIIERLFFRRIEGLHSQNDLIELNEKIGIISVLGHSNIIPVFDTVNIIRQ